MYFILFINCVYGPIRYSGSRHLETVFVCFFFGGDVKPAKIGHAIDSMASRPRYVLSLPRECRECKQ